MGVIRFRVATEFNVVNVVVPEAVQQEVDRRIAARICLGCGQPLSPDDPAKLNQCSTCYSATYRGVKAGLWTHEELAKKGQIAKRPVGRPCKNEYTASLKKKR